MSPSKFSDSQKRTDYKVLGNLFWNVINTSSYAIILMHDMKIVHCNKMACDMFAAKPEDLIGMTVHDFSPEFQPDGSNSAKEGEAIYQKILVEGSFDFEWTHKKLNGELFLANVSIGFFESDGSDYVSIILRDITQQRKEHIELAEYRHQLEDKVKEKTLLLENKQIELENLLAENKQLLSELSSRFTDVYEYSSDAITFLDVEENGKLKILDMNPAAQSLFKVNSVQISKGVYAEDILPQEKIRDFKQKLLPVILSGTSVSFTGDHDTGNGYWNSTVYPIKNEKGKIYRIAAFSRNVTAEVEKEQIASILNSAIESLPYEVWITDKNGRCLIQNKQAEKVVGNVIGKTPDELNLPDQLKKITIENINRALSGEFVNFETVYFKAGVSRNILVNIQPVWNRNEIWGVIGINFDITDRKKDEEKIRVSEEQYRLLAENIHDVIWKMDIGTLKYTYMSPSIYKLTGYTVDEALKMTIDDFLMPASLKEIHVELPERLELFKKGGPQFYNFEYELRHKQGHTLWVEINTSFVTNNDGEIKEIVATSRDITERRRMIETLRENEERYSLINKLSGTIVYDYRISDKSTLWAGATDDVIGFSVEELNSMDADALSGNIYPEDLNNIEPTQDEQYSRQGFVNNQFRYLTKSGNYIWVESQAYLLTDIDKKPYRWLGIMKDITEQYKAKEQLTESELKFRTIFNATKDGIILLNKHHDIIDLNFSAQKRLGYTRDEVLQKKSYEIIIGSEVADINKRFQALDEDKVMGDFETVVNAKDKTPIPVEISVSKSVLGKEDVFLLIVRDILERKQLEKELLNSVINTEEKERLNFSQELHDGLGPLLSAAKIYVDWLDKPNANIKKEEIVPDIRKLLEEATTSIRDISFKLSPHILKNYGIVEAVKAYVEKTRILTNIEIDLKYNAIPRFDETFETVIYRVVCECITNVLNHAKAHAINLDIRYDNNRFAILFTDDGIGFDINKVMESRKGIGLLNMQSRIKLINGSISFKSSPGKGTRIDIEATR
jgi:PAS domain S-box-containing protein